MQKYFYVIPHTLLKGVTSLCEKHLWKTWKFNDETKLIGNLLTEHECATKLEVKNNIQLGKEENNIQQHLSHMTLPHLYLDKEYKFFDSCKSAINR